MAEPTYIFRNGKVYAMVDGTIVASVKESEFSENAFGGLDFADDSHPIQGEVEMPPPPSGIAANLMCPNCGHEGEEEVCPQCGEMMSEAVDPNVPSFDDAAASGEFGPEGIPGHAIAKQIVTTPNGLKGRVLARVPSLWGEEVTVRFENGVIKKIPVDQKLTFSAADETPEGQTPVEALQERLAKSVLSDRDSLIERVKELEAVKKEAASRVSVSSDEDAAALDRISVQADYELREINDALAHIASEEVEAFEPPAPIEGLPTVEQASHGGTHANWLDRTVQAMVAEANDTDYEKLMDEGPEAFVAGLDDGQLADAKTVRLMASREIRSHTAGADDGIREQYEKVWLARCEDVRKTRLASRKEEVRKQASSEEPVDAPDESLFM